MTSQNLFNTILVHVARTWERTRLEQEYNEMPCDNIASVDEIVQIADEILQDEIIQEFLNTDDKNDFFMRKTSLLSDSYIEKLAKNIITKNFIN